jgi:2-polyprenyl-6-methoxyphenol hydroxylase-like FAD-dependent oxidoreductase
VEKHAVVLGAGIGGLLAARVLTDVYDDVTIVERDALPEGNDHRRGVPQGRHGHLLLSGGSDAVEDLFPGILDELVADGAPVLGGALSDLWQIFNGHTIRHESGTFATTMRAYQSSRPFLEGHIRRRLQASPVKLLDGHDVVSIRASGTRVCGVRVAPRGGGPESDIAADLVVDAMGRSARTPAFLQSLGFDRPSESCTVVRVAYSSHFLRIAAPTPAAKLFLVGTVPERPTGGVLLAVEDNTWIFTALGMVGHEPPLEWDALLDFAASWAPEPMLSALHRAEPIGDGARYRYANSQWRRYDKLRRFPDGLLVFGDAISSFNPIYGQGMSVAALEAIALQKCLRDGDDQLARRFFDATLDTISAAWQMSTGADLAVPQVKGRRTPATRLSAWYTGRIAARCATDLSVHEQFFRVVNMLDRPSRLMSPSMMRRVLLPRRTDQSCSEAPSRSAAAT